MALTDELAAGPALQPKLNKVESWIASLEPSERDAANAMINNPEWSAMRIAAAFGRNGLNITSTSIIVQRNKIRDAR